MIAKPPSNRQSIRGWFYYVFCYLQNVKTNVSNAKRNRPKVIKSGKREEFLNQIKEQGIITDSKAETGNLKYEYSIPIEDNNALNLLEIWTDAEAQKAHGATSHYEKLTKLKAEYVTDVKIEKYEIETL